MIEKKIFGIYDSTTKEVLSNNLKFDDMPELLGAYQSFYPNHEIVAFYEVVRTKKRLVIKENAEFKAQWYLLVEQNISNFF